MVVKSGPDNSGNGAQTPKPANRGYPFLNPKIWDDAVGVMQADENEDWDQHGDKNEDKNADKEEGEEEWLEPESEKELQVPAQRGELQVSALGRELEASVREGTMVSDDVSINT